MDDQRADIQAAGDGFLSALGEGRFGRRRFEPPGGLIIWHREDALQKICGVHFDTHGSQSINDFGSTARALIS
jgi:hypothetical protein